MISNFFEILAKEILSVQTKLDKLYALKKTMLVKMFPQGDALLPEIRLNGFKGEWKCSPAKEIFKSVRDNEKTYFKGWGSLILLGIAFTILAIMLGVLCAFFGEAFKFVLGILISVAATYYNMVFMYLCAKCIK